MISTYFHIRTALALMKTQFISHSVTTAFSLSLQKLTLLRSFSHGNRITKIESPFLTVNAKRQLSFQATILLLKSANTRAGGKGNCKIQQMVIESPTQPAINCIRGRTKMELYFTYLPKTCLFLLPFGVVL